MSESNAPVYVRVGDENGQVVVLFTKDPEGSFPSNISQWRTDPAECLEIVAAMADAAFRAGEGMKPVGPALKATLVEQHRMKLTQRFALMLSTMRGDKLVSNGQIAQRMVDAALQEIF